MSEWQPIDTTPKDVKVLTWDGENCHIAVLEDGTWWVLVGDDYAAESRGSMTALTIEPTHWMALPEPPA